MSLEVTDRQFAVFQFLEQFVSEKGYAPTREEISKHFGFRSNNAAEMHLRALEKHGAIRIDPVARGIVLLCES